MPLSGKQRRALRALGHHLEPVVQVGKEGITPAVLRAVEEALGDHELIKLKVGENSPVDRHEVADALAEETGGEIAQVLGRTLLLFRRHPDDPKIALPGMPLPPKPASDDADADAPRSTRRPAKAPARKAPVRKATARKTPARKTSAGEGPRRAPARTGRPSGSRRSE